MRRLESGMSFCGCSREASSLSSLPLRRPPDPSLVWHLLSDEPFTKAPDCDWSPLGGSSPPLSGSSVVDATLVVVSLLSLCLLVLLLCVFCALWRRKKRRGSAAQSTEAIVTSGDGNWSYNSMKSHGHILPSHHNSMGNSIYGTAIVHGIATPASLRHNNNPHLPYHRQSTFDHPPLRHTNSAQVLRQSTLRMVPRSPPSSSPFHTLGRHYEEIADPPPPLRGGLPYVVNCSREGISYTLGPSAGKPPLPHGRSLDHSTPPTRYSVRRPPPQCPPPAPPPHSADELSPRSSSSDSLGMDREVGGEGEFLPHSGDSPPSRGQYEERGRESGYGTAPSRQWRSPQGSKGSSDDRPPSRHAPLQPSASMTYV